MSATVSPSPLLAGMLPFGAATAEFCTFRGNVSLTETDQMYVQTAVQKRKDEFAAGRLCASAALEALGVQGGRVGREDGGAPVWPDGVVGSISHTDEVALAVAARATEFQTIGLDVEQIGAVEPTLWPTLFTDVERSTLSTHPIDNRRIIATGLFAAKEAFYKAQWPVTREWVDFLDIEIRLKGSSFVVTPRLERGWTSCLGRYLNGSFSVRGKFGVAVVWNTARSRQASSTRLPATPR